MRPLVAEIDLDALRHNYRLSCECAPNSQSVAVIKADAYGHGAIECARALEGLAPAFAVACIEEALTLRQAGIQAPIILLEGIFEASELALVDEHRLWMAVHTDWQLEALLAFTPHQPIPVWLKVDSGMHRLGFSPQDAEEVWWVLSQAPQVTALHLMSHFASADAEDSGYLQKQMAVLQALSERLQAPMCLANSPATLAHPAAHGHWNRPGVMLYGSDPLEMANAKSRQLAPVMTLRSEVMAIRELEGGEPVGYGGRWRTPERARIAVVAGGYGDGYDRHAVDGTPVLVDGQPARVAGKVSMDMLTVDITHLPDTVIGSEVVLWGRASNGAVLPVDDVARYCDTISYTLLTGILPRVPRRYQGVSSPLPTAL